MWSYLVLLICFCSLFESKTLESGTNKDNDANLHVNDMMKGNATNSGRNSTDNGKPEIGDVHIKIKSEVTEESQIPPSLKKKLETANIRDFLKLLHGVEVANKTVMGSHKKRNRGGRTYVADEVIETLGQPDLCSVRDMTVDLPLDPNPNIFLWPRCILMKRCGGCSDQSIMECVPTKTMKVPIQVFKCQFPYPRATYFDFIGMETVFVDKHIECESKCQVQESHCTRDQVYIAHDCRCVCKNADMATKCTSGKVWDSSACQCDCATILNCGRLATFNRATCQCDIRHGASIDVDDDFSNSSIEVIKAADVQITGPCKRFPCPKNWYGTQLSDGRCRCLQKSKSTTEAPTTTTEAPTTTETTTAKTTTKVVNAKCAHLTCRPRWVPQLLKNGRCACKPNFKRPTFRRPIRTKN